MARSPDSPESVPPPIITLLTDFGAADVFVGSMKGVILGINPHAQIIDLTHDIPAHNIRAGAYLLHSASRHFPPGTIRSEEHTSELQSLAYLVCRLLLEKKKQRIAAVSRH